MTHCLPLARRVFAVWRAWSVLAFAARLLGLPQKDVQVSEKIHSNKSVRTKRTQRSYLTFSTMSAEIL
jgi:hypothetical protein